MDHLAATLAHLQAVSAANTEEARKLQFINYINQVFGPDTSARAIINQLAGGAEKKVLNIPKGDRSKTGFADTQYRKVIIEFEYDIKNKSKLEHAKYQLQEYFAGNFNTDKTFDFVLIATDCVRWAVYGAKPESYLGKARLTPEEVVLKEVDSFVLTDETAPRYLAFLDRYLFRFEKQQPTLEAIQIDFGDSSSLFVHVLGHLRAYYDTVRDEPEIQTAYQQWERFMSVAYGSFKGSESVFLVHTYLSVTAKLIAYEVLTRDAYIDFDEMRGVLDGTIFARLQVENFVENDFYQWVTIEKHYYLGLHRIFHHVAEKISDYDFSRVDSDILKGVYQRLIDLETRHALGEYYTPDWLCQQVTEHFEFERHATVLDPSCGSGSFLMAVVRRFRQLHPDLPVDELAAQVMGIDIHPLSVQIAKTTLLLALGEEVRNAPRPIALRVFLANSLEIPERRDNVTMFNDEFRVKVDQRNYFIKTDVLGQPDLYDRGVTTADMLAETTKHEPELDESTFLHIVTKRTGATDRRLLTPFHDLYRGLKVAKETGRDSIWKFILLNTYKPFFLQKRVDYVLGNPPWFTFNSIKNADYQRLLKRLAEANHLVPAQKAYMPQLEIAAIFMSHVADFLLRPGGRLAFVLPRSFLSAGQHDATRAGRAKGFQLTEVWDLKDVDNLFNVPSCVLFAQQAPVPRPVPAAGLPGRTYAGRPRQHNATWDAAANHLRVVSATWYFTQLQDSSALSTSQRQSSGGTNPYREQFRNGATMFPRNFYFVRLEGPTPPDWHDRLLPVRSDEANDKDAKEPWKNIKLRGHVNSRYLFRTALARHLVPFGLIAPPLVLLPIEIEETPTTDGLARRIRLLDHQALQRAGELETAKWFKNVEDEWVKNRTEKNAVTTAVNYLNWQQKLTEQDSKARYTLVYAASGKDANAILVDRQELDLEFFVENKAYGYVTDNYDEGNYLACFLNSDFANEMMKPFQSQGLFGARDVHRKILDVPLPRFNAANADHQHLAYLGKVCAEKVREYIAAERLETREYNVGKVRSHLRNALLRAELTEIDAVLKGIIEAA